METGPRFIVSSDRLEKPEIESAIPDLRGEGHNHYAMEASLVTMAEARLQRTTLANQVQIDRKCQLYS